MKRICQPIWILLLSFVLSITAQAEGFSVGGAVGFPGVFEARVAYETEGFGIRGYAAYPGIFGADGYVRFVTDELGSGYRLGGGAWLIPMPGGAGLRGLLGAVFAFTPAFSLALELRPIVPFNLQGAGGLDLLALLLFLSSFSIGLEFKL